MSTPSQWYDRLTLRRRTEVGVDPITQRPTFTLTDVLVNEPCDLTSANRRSATQTNAGTQYMTVRTPIAKICPDDVTKVPDQNDTVEVNGKRYRVTDVRHSWDPGSGRYMGSQLDLSQPEDVDTPYGR